MPKNTDDETLGRRVKRQQQQHTRCNPLVCADVLCAEHDFRTRTTRSLDRRSTRNDESDGLLEPTLDLQAHRRTKDDARIEREDLHGHVRAALFRPSRGRRVRPGLVRLGVLRLWFAQERLGEGVERQMGARPAWGERVSAVEGEVRAWVGWVE